MNQRIPNLTLFSLCGTVLLLGQVPGFPSTYEISGIVRDGSTEGPVSSAMVVVSQRGMDVGQVLSDSTGKYTLLLKTPGDIRIEATAAGYLRAVKRTTLEATKATATVDLALVKAGVIAGRVEDADHSPVARVAVSVRSEGYHNGRPGLISFHTKITNDRGEFRIGGLFPGEYVIHATPPLMEISLKAPSSDKEIDTKEPVFKPAAAYFGGSSTRDGAATVTIAPGTKREDITLTLRDAPSACIQASIPPAVARSANGDWISVLIAEPYPMSQSKVAMGRFRGGGGIEVCGVAPGQYRLSASAQMNPKQRIYAHEYFSVTGKNGVVPLQPLSFHFTEPVTGQIVAQAADKTDILPKLDTKALSIVLEPTDRLRDVAEDLVAAIGPDGSFRIPATFNTDYWIRIQGVPANAYVKSVVASGMEVYGPPYRPTMGPLTLTLGVDGASVSGSALRNDGKPAAASAVILARRPFPTTPAPSDIIRLQCDENGRYSRAGISPGLYVMAAVEGLVAGEEWSLPMLQLLSRNGVEVHLAPGTTATQQLKAR